MEGQEAPQERICRVLTHTVTESPLPLTSFDRLRLRFFSPLSLSPSRSSLLVACVLVLVTGSST